MFIFGVTSCNTTTYWNSIFHKHNVTGTFVLKNISTQKTYLHDSNRSKKEFVQASTFKILNSMIALQVGAVASVDDTIKWDGVDHRYKSWNGDQTMRTALPISCVWFYQELARKVGEKKMQEWLTKVHYGNENIDNKITRFWLDGNLKISAIEQVEFIEKLVKNELPFDMYIQNIVKNIMITDSTSNYVIHSKTGWSKQIGWNVGYVEIKNGVWIFLR